MHYNGDKLMAVLLGFELEAVSSVGMRLRLTGLSIHPTFSRLGDRDLKCTIPTIVLRKRTPGSMYTAVS